MKQKTPSMAHQSSAEYDEHNQIPPQPLPLELIKKPHLPKHNTESDDEQEQQEKDEETPSASKLTKTNVGIALEEVVVPPAAEAEDSGRERLKRHRIEVAGRVWIPEIWGQEELLKDWIDSRTFDAPLVPSRIMTARAALAKEGRRASTGELRIQYRC